MSGSSKSRQNKLSSESSPYLLQHADNPVNWRPWGDEAFKKAQKEDKPVFVSIGYATCHWCHVMAHESFEDEQVASLMNEAFINIKVDREERPDIDNTYMLVCQMLTGSGGWPLNVLLTPDKEPFYAATYIPKQGRHGRPGMLELIPWISQLWKNEREKISNSSNEIVSTFKQSNSFTAGDRLSKDVLDKAYSQYEQQFDEKYGGFGSAPKFPSAHNLMLQMRYHTHASDSQALPMVSQTLAQMRMGGIFDHIGLGFHRYSTDREWLVPHFEKMLYDQAMLLIAYTEAWQLTKNNLFKHTADEIVSYVSRMMQDPNGGFYSAEDADSEGEEGKFYIWNVKEIRKILNQTEAELAIEVFNFSEHGNYRDEASGQRTGNNIPHLAKPVGELARERNLKPNELASHLKDIRKKLMEVREKRIHPLLDDKILTDWNGLMMAALAKAGSAFQNQEYLAKSKHCWEFIFSNLITERGQLKHRYRNGDVAIDAHADDFAFLVWGLIELYEATFDSRYLQHAIALNKKFIDNFWDEKDGGFFFTSESAEELLSRKKEIYDGAIPSGNSVAMMNLLRLARLTGQTEWEAMADQMNERFAETIRKAPTGFGFALQSIEFVTAKSQEIIIAGKKDNPLTQQMLTALNDHFLPNAVVLLNDPEDEHIIELAPFLSNFKMQDEKTTAYVCQNYSCELPTHNPDEMMKIINNL